MSELFHTHPIIFLIALTVVIFILRLVGLGRNWITGIGIAVVLGAAIYAAWT